MYIEDTSRVEKSVINRVVKRARAVLRVISLCYARIRHNARYIALRGAVAGFRVTGHCLAYTARCASKARITIYAQARHRSGFVLPPISFHVSAGRGAK